MREYFDIIIVGCGISGLTAGIYLKEAGFNVVVITKNKDIAESNTNYAQGGIVAYKEGDKKENLINDILVTGCYYNN